MGVSNPMLLIPQHLGSSRVHNPFIRTNGSHNITRYATCRTKHHSFAVSLRRRNLVLANEKAVGSTARDNPRISNQHYLSPSPLCSGEIFEGGVHESSSGPISTWRDYHILVNPALSRWILCLTALNGQREGYIYDSEKNRYLLSPAAKWPAD